MDSSKRKATAKAKTKRIVRRTMRRCVLTTFKVKGGFIVATALWNGKVFSDHTFMDNGATAWMTLPEPYKEE